ncbi:PR domain zinc finger protein 5-like isoform X2 [Hydractinia symbiolongicarpus]|uniref:PR domain zinc finger protein 5-like isoform X2 n=1 Tax=Hydractinia symbiolongicarpus TaxID=13093 RepID=UPI00254A60A7|nr:PR domain zinc finger protein 5-like isoform X2 [Hydractinia symbiolongicarpus]
MSEEKCLASDCRVIIKPCTDANGSQVTGKRKYVQNEHANEQYEIDSNKTRKVILKKLGDKLIAIVCNKEKSTVAAEPAQEQIVNTSATGLTDVSSASSYAFSSYGKSPIKKMPCHPNGVWLGNTNCTPQSKLTLPKNLSPGITSSPITNNLHISTNLFQDIDSMNDTAEESQELNNSHGKSEGIEINSSCVPHSSSSMNQTLQQSGSDSVHNTDTISSQGLVLTNIAPCPMAASITSMFAAPQHERTEDDEDNVDVGNDDEEEEEDKNAAALFHVAESLLLLKESSSPWKFCVSCKQAVNGYCTIHGNPMDSLPKTKAVLSLPSSMSIQTSSIPHAGLGVFALTTFEVGSLFGPMDGEKLSARDHAQRGNNPYVWEVYEENRKSISHFLDCMDEGKSNWMRFINCARFEEEQNLIAEQYDKLLFYKTYKKVLPGQELLVWYGNAYGRELREQFQCPIKTLPIEGDVYYGAIESNKEIDCQSESISGEMELGKWKLRQSYVKTGVTESECDNTEIELNFTCKSCGAMFDSLYYLQRHNQFVCPASSKVRCYVCSKRFNSVYSLERHKKRGHDIQKQFSCLLCSAAFTSKGNLRVHVNTHLNVKEHRCEYCGMKFSRSTFLRSHVLAVHQKEKPYVCPTCGRKFSRSDSLNRHRNIHKKAKNILCEVCGARFNSNDSLRHHMRTLHSADAEMTRGECSECGIVYDDITTHEAYVHQIKKKAKCTVCSKEVVNLLSHMTSHKTAGFTQCPLCGLYFMRLNGHMKIHYNMEEKEKDLVF